MAIADILLTPATIWYAPVGTAAPADSLAYGAAWGGAWTNLGYTTTPLTIGVTRETYEVFVEQLANPVKEIVTSESLVFETTLAEFTGRNLALAFSGTVTETPPGAGQVGKTELVTGGQTSLDTFAFGFEGLYKDSSNNEFPVRIFVWIANPVLNGQLQFAKNKEAGLPLQIKAKADTGKSIGEQLMKIQKITAAATS